MPERPSKSSFGRYTLIERIGRGGMGETWKARRADLKDAPVVVIKRILPQHAQDPGFVESFVNEAHVTASLQHPAIAQVLDFGQIKGEYFFVIEYVHGRTVDQLIDAAAAKGLPALPVPIACFIAVEILAGLQYAHSRNREDGEPLKIVHRDISPDNLLVGFDGSLKLVDFGVAKSRMKNRSETQVGLVKGKWPYFSPEQATAQPLDGRSDLWAMGVVLYRMVCGQLPFSGEWALAVRKIIRGEYPRPLLLNPGLPTPVVDAIDRALQVAAPKRFQSAEKMAIGLRSALKAAAPDFDRSMFKDFVHWAFDTGEGVSAARLEIIERWVSQARHAALEAGERKAQHPGTVAAHTAFTRGPSAVDHRTRTLLMGAFALFAGGGLTATIAFLALRPAPERRPEVVSAIGPRAQAFNTVAAAFRALDALRPQSASAARPRYLALSKQAGGGEGAMPDADYLAACEAFLTSLRDLGEAPEPAVDAGSAAADAPVDEEPLPEVDTVALQGRSKLTLKLQPRIHDLIALVLPLEEPEMLKFDKRTDVLLVNYSNTAIAVATEKTARGPRYQTFCRGTKQASASANEAHFIDFNPFVINTALIPVTFGSAMLVGGEQGPVRFERKAPVKVLGRRDGHFLVLSGLTGAKRVGFRVKGPATVVVNCGATSDTLGAEALNFTAVKECALALVGAPSSRPVDVEVTVDPGVLEGPYEVIDLDLSVPAHLTLDRDRHNLSPAARALAPKRRWSGKLPVPVRFLADGQGTAFLEVGIGKFDEDKKLQLFDMPHNESIPDAHDLRMIDFRPLEVVDPKAPEQFGKIREMFHDGLTMWATTMGRQQGHFIEVRGVEQWRSVEFSRPPGTTSRTWGAVAHCDGKTKVVQDHPARFENPSRCAVALAEFGGETGTEEVIVTGRGRK